LKHSLSLACEACHKCRRQTTWQEVFLYCIFSKNLVSHNRPDAEIASALRYVVLALALLSRRWAYSAAVAAFSINAATSCACERKIAWLPGSSMTCDWARFDMNRSRSGLIIRSCVGITA